jgi:hypothetical protein
VDAQRRILFESRDGVRSRVPACEIVNLLRAPEVNAGSARFAYTPSLSEIILAIRNNVRPTR